MGVRAQLFMLAFSLASCSEGDSPMQAFLGGDQLQDIENVMLKGSSSRQLEDLQHMSFAEYYKALVKGSSNHKMMVNGRVVGNAHKALVDAGPLFASLNSRFKSVGQFHDSGLVGQNRQLSRNQIRVAISRLAQGYAEKSGWFTPSAALALSAELELTAAPAVVLTEVSQQRRNIAALMAIAVASVAHRPSLGLITNGTDCTNPSTVLLQITNKNKTMELCTGVYVSTSQVRTAAHCTANAAVIAGASSKSGKGSLATSFSANPAYDINKPNATIDQGEVKFPPNPGQSYAKVAAAPPVPGEAITQVGVGYTEGPSSGTIGDMHCGSNVIQDAAIAQGQFTISGVASATPGVTPGTQSVAAQGDSGGPAFNSQGELIGNASMVKPDGTQASYTTANSAQSEAFYNKP